MDFKHGVRLCTLQEEDTAWDGYDSLSVMHEKKKNNNSGLGYADCRETASGG